MAQPKKTMDYTGPAIIARELEKSVMGLLVYTPANSEFQEGQEFYNHSLVSQPLVIVQPDTDDKVSRVVRFCVSTSLPLGIRCGGHDFFGRSLANGGVLIDMRAMSSIVIAPDRNSVRVGGGVIAGTLQHVLHTQNLFTPIGQSKSVGYVSWACGGGYGFYVGTYGFGVDQILGAKVAVASGCIVDTDEDPELLWALRGTGAGTFGVVVELRVRVYPAPVLYAGFLTFPLAEAATVFGRFQKLAEEGFPDEFSGDAIAAHPDMLPLNVSEPCFTFLWCWTATDGDLTSAKRLLHRMTELGPVLANTVQETTAAAYGVGDSSSAVFFRSRNVRSLQPELGVILANNLPPQPLSAVIIHNNHGKCVRRGVNNEANAAFANRYEHVILGLHGGGKQGMAPDLEAVSEATNWTKSLEHAIDGANLSLNGGFPSFHPPEQVDAVKFFGKDTTERLRLLKKRIDPGNLFRNGLPGLQHHTEM